MILVIESTRNSAMQLLTELWVVGQLIHNQTNMDQPEPTRTDKFGAKRHETPVLQR